MVCVFPKFQLYETLAAVPVLRFEKATTPLVFCVTANEGLSGQLVFVVTLMAKLKGVEQVGLNAVIVPETI